MDFPLLRTPADVGTDTLHWLNTRGDDKSHALFQILQEDMPALLAARPKTAF